ncbi:MAG: hypothetical protein HPY50_18815 [Firmicutes bacterium]|nr:hypothetical protein [Bacillota bacterium]
MAEVFQRDPFLRTVAVIVLAVFGLGVIYAVFASIPGTGPAGGSQNSTLVVGAISILMKLLLIGSVAGLGVGILMLGRERTLRERGELDDEPAI